MLPKNLVRGAATAVALITLVVGGMLISSTRARAREEEDRENLEVRIGFDIAPVQLNLAGKNRELVGLGSYIVNAQGDCNGCHSAGPATEFASGGNPYFGQPTTVNPATYLGGGRDFGPFPGQGPFPHIFSRNLTPDKTGKPEGGHTFSARFSDIHFPAALDA